MTSSRVRKMGTLLLVFASSTPACGQTTGQAAQFPNTPAGQQLSQLLAAFNTGDKDTMRKYLEVNFPGRLNKLDEDLRFREGTGGFDLRKVEDSKPLRLISIVHFSIRALPNRSFCARAGYRRLPEGPSESQ